MKPREFFTTLDGSVLIAEWDEVADREGEAAPESPQGDAALAAEVDIRIEGLPPVFHVVGMYLAKEALDAGESEDHAQATYMGVMKFGMMLQEHDARLELEELSRRLPPTP